MKELNAFVGLGVHKERISVAVAEAERGGEVRSLGSVANSVDALNRLVRRLTDRFAEVEFVQEAGPCGYGVHRHLQQLGQTGCVAASVR